MWEQENKANASFRVSGWKLEVQCGADDLRLVTAHDASADITGLISLVDSSLPSLAESFIRGDELHLIMPQAEGTAAALEICLLVIQADRECLIVESTLSLQTLWLGAYPAVKLDIPGNGPLVSSTKDSAKVFSRDKETHRPKDSLEVSVFVDERDQLSIDATNANSEGVHFFGEFMEKGVIRKVQPWWVWTCGSLRDTQIDKIVSSLGNRPLPLAG